MRGKCYLIVSKKGVSDMRKQYPSRKPGEIVVAVNLTIPDKAFEPIEISGTLTVPEDQVSNPLQELEIRLETLKEAGEE